MLGAIPVYHFSDDPGIEAFVPRPVRTPSPRAPGMEWLNGPLVWAIDERHQPMYLFPRDCPRILLWKKPNTTESDVQRFWSDSDARMIAFAERSWAPAIEAAILYRYTLPEKTFEDLRDAGMFVSRAGVRPLRMETLHDLPAALAAEGAELRFLDSLAPLRDVWSTSLHASGIRLRNAVGFA